MIPPLFVRFRIKNEDHRFGIWFPLFIIWLLLLPLVILALLFLGIAMLVVSDEWRKRLGKIAAAVYTIICQLRHLYVEVESRKESILIRFV